MRTTILLFPLLTVLAAPAQEPSSFETRQATGNGPYPVHIDIQRVFPTSGISEFQRFAADQVYRQRFPRAGGRVTMSGYDVRGGFIMAGPHFPRWWPNWCVEMDYQNLVRTFEGKPSGHLQMRQEFFSVRPIGVRYNVFYPLTVQYTAGLVLAHAITAEVNFSTSADSASVVRAHGAFLDNGGNDIFGIDQRFRITFFDPVGSAGGLGVYWEGQWTWMGRDLSLHDFYALANDGADHKSNFSYITWSMGVTVPLALKFR